MCFANGHTVVCGLIKLKHNDHERIWIEISPAESVFRCWGQFYLLETVPGSINGMAGCRKSACESRESELRTTCNISNTHRSKISATFHFLHYSAGFRLELCSCRHLGVSFTVWTSPCVRLVRLQDNCI